MTKLTMKPLVAAAALLGMAFSASAFAAECNACHSNVAKDHAGAVHASVDCASCHSATKEHLKDIKARPSTNMVRCLPPESVQISLHDER